MCFWMNSTPWEGRRGGGGGLVCGRLVQGEVGQKMRLCMVLVFMAGGAAGAGEQKTLSCYATPQTPMHHPSNPALHPRLPPQPQHKPTWNKQPIE
jgi:hypothetical protein